MEYKKFLNFVYKPFDILYKLKINDFVHVSRQKIPWEKGYIKNIINNPNDKYDQHFQVEFLDQLLLSFKPKRLTIIEREPLSIILCPETEDYRKLARSQIFENERVLEIGSDYGNTTNIISKSTKNAFGIDKSFQHVKLAKNTYPHIQFYIFDVLINNLETFGKFDKVFIDIGGDRNYEAVEELLTKVIHQLNPSQIYVKNRQLYLRNKSLE